MDIRKSGEAFERHSDWDSHAHDSVRLVDDGVTNPLHPTHKVSSVFIGRRTLMTYPEGEGSGVLTDVLTVELTSFPREAGYSFRDKFIMEARPDGTFGPVRQMSEARMAGAPEQVPYRPLHASDMPKNQAEIDLNFGRAMGMVDEAMRRAEAGPDPAAA
ncbi:MAG TPA: hypothetical protein VLF40_06440 [Candidatus Saccharimonadales bacterium]|nr:hypothetical protein [Candidatus Saccharimonadales bacterium]